MDKDLFTITNTTKSTLPSVSFVEMKNKVLGKKYNLSLVFIGEKKSAELNNSYRGKNHSTNILSFSLDKTHGEIFITPAVARRQLKDFNRKYDNFIGFLFIHGLLHLKGMEHGSTMEEAEEKIRKIFSI